MYSIEGGVVVMNGVESSLVYEFKEKRDQDPIFLRLKSNVHKQKLMSFEQGEIVCSRIMLDCVYVDVIPKISNDLS